MVLIDQVKQAFLAIIYWFLVATEGKHFQDK